MLAEKEIFIEQVAARDDAAVQKFYDEVNHFEIAQALSELSDEDMYYAFELIDNRYLRDVFKHLEEDVQQDVVEYLGKDRKKLANLLNELKPDDRTALLENMPEHLSLRMIQLLSPEERRIAVKLLGYPEESVGRLMTSEYVAVGPHFSIAEVIEHIRNFGRDSETLNVLYVVDDKLRLVDDLRIREILLASPDKKVEDLMDHSFVSLNATDDQETAVKVFLDRDRVALPVVDAAGVMLGMVTVDDVMDVAQEESTEDFHRFGAMREAVNNPLTAPIIQLYKNRIVWLFALVFMNVFSGYAMQQFEATIQAMVSLVFFLPLLIDSGGNAGAQSATLMVRALATGEVALKDWAKLVGKEVFIALLLGVTMAAAVSLVAGVRAPEIAAIVAVSMVCIVLVGSVFGLLLPFIFTRLKLDPAAASAPLITSVSDISGVIIYFSIATWYLS